MSALRIEKRKSTHPEGKLEEKWCVNNCNPGGIPRNGLFKVTIAAYPAGFMCYECVKNWRQWWDEAIDDEPVENTAKTAA